MFNKEPDLIFALSKTILRRLAVRDVTNITKKVNRVSLGVCNYRAVQIHPYEVTISVDVTFFEIK